MLSLIFPYIYSFHSSFRISFRTIVATTNTQCVLLNQTLMVTLSECSAEELFGGENDWSIDDTEDMIHREPMEL